MAIEIKQLIHTYASGSPFEVTALKGINLCIEQGEFVGLIGHTGSGKSTLIQHLNGLLTPTSGEIWVDGVQLHTKGTDIKDIRRKVGMVFQYPENQLFEETIFKDIAFGPQNMGITGDQLEQTVYEAMELVGLDVSLKDKSPFELSGGQKRRVAIAGVIAMRPNILVLDEPIAGLDPMGRRKVLDIINTYHAEYNATIILVSHNMEDIAKTVNRVLVIQEGQIAMDGTPVQVFNDTQLLRSHGLEVPLTCQLCELLRDKGMQVPEDIITIEQLYDFISQKGAHR